VMSSLRGASWRNAARPTECVSVKTSPVDNFDTQLSQSGAILRAALKKERRNWKLPEPLRAQPGLEAFSPVFRQILHGRGVVRQSQLDPWLQTDLGGAPDPFLLKDMAVACDLIAQTIAAGERIAVYGDYDADGVTACVTLARGLRSVGADVITYIPNRFTEGYGLNLEALNDLHTRGARLVITCDCGTNSVEAAAGRPRGMRLIVTDHHEVGAQRPAVDALVNPKQPDCPYPFDGLAACGVAYKLLVALERRTFPGKLDPGASLDAVALGPSLMSCRYARKTARSCVPAFAASVSPPVRAARHCSPSPASRLRSPRSTSPFSSGRASMRPDGWKMRCSLSSY
jgi:hypothetical protein